MNNNTNRVSLYGKDARDRARFGGPDEEGSGHALLRDVISNK